MLKRRSSHVWVFNDLPIINVKVRDCMDILRSNRGSIYALTSQNTKKVKIGENNIYRPVTKNWLWVNTFLCLESRVGERGSSEQLERVTNALPERNCFWTKFEKKYVKSMPCDAWSINRGRRLMFSEEAKKGFFLEGLPTRSLDLVYQLSIAT